MEEKIDVHGELERVASFSNGACYRDLVLLDKGLLGSGKVYIETGWGVYRKVSEVKVDGDGNVYLEKEKGR